MFLNYFLVGDADDDDRTLDTGAGLVSAGVAGERVHDAGGCEAVSGVAAVSAVWAGEIVCCAEGGGGSGGVAGGGGRGGRRAARTDSVNTGWRNESFRGYADYMQTPQFAGEIDWLMALADF